MANVIPSVQRRKVWLTTTTRVPCINAAMMRNPLKLARVSQTNETISATSGPKFTKLCGHVEEILLLDKFFPIVDTCLSCKDIAPQICGMVPRWLLHAVFSASRAQHVSDLHSKFTPRPHHVWRYGRHPISDCWDYARKTKKAERRRNHRMKIYMACPIT